MKNLFSILCLILLSALSYAKDLYEPTTENLVQAIEANDVPRLQNLIRQGVNVNAKYGFRYPIHYVALYGSPEILQILIADKINLNVEDDLNADTPLHITVSQKKYALAQILVTNGEDPNVIDEAGDSPLHLAAQDLVMLKIILSSALININFVNSAGETPLMRASGNPDPDSNVVSTLLAIGADKTLVDDQGLTALARAQNWLSYFQRNPGSWKDQIVQEKLIISALNTKNSNASNWMR